MSTDRENLHVILARPRGFCAGVERAIEIVEQALMRYGAPIYVRHQIVHNHDVVERLRARGAVFVEDVDEVPEGEITVFSAHGVSRNTEAEAQNRGLDVIDATCPLVRKVHKEGERYAGLGYDVVLIGHAGHPEVEGTRGRIDGRLHVIATAQEVADLDVADPSRVAYITQTTLSVLDTRKVIAALRSRFPDILGPDTRDICYATQNRQMALLGLIDDVDLVLVVGAPNSSNSNRLRELGESHGIASRLIQGPDGIVESWLDDVAAVGLTAGASAPEHLVQDVLIRLAEIRPITVEERIGVAETVSFRLPESLYRVRRSAA
jgi:4-hydroxy-3-methylbut-2-en-1-yl diphosphate reductase